MEKTIQTLLLLTILSRSNTMELMDLIWAGIRVGQVSFGFKWILLISLEAVV